MGLPGAGKTYLAERLYKHLNCAWYNADRVREMANDWEFSPTARLRQARRMSNIANFEIENGRSVICDFVCPLKETREIFDADCTVWVNTVDQGRFEDTNRLFEPPKDVQFTITHHMKDKEIIELANSIQILCM